MKIAYTLLHYQSKEITIKAVDCLLEQNSVHEIYIIIVDNASSNGSGNELYELYNSKKNIVVLLSQENSGFAKGNNIGYKYAKSILKADIIVVMNNDVYINDSQFSNKLSEVVCRDNDVAIIAPDILSYRGEHQNPLEQDSKSNSQLIAWIIKVGILRILFSIPILNKFICKKLILRENRFLEEKHNKSMITKDYTTKKYNVMVHGACVIFTPKWVHAENVAFLPYTFMFAEEYLMYDYLKYRKYTTLYDPNLLVEHEDGATQQIQARSAVKKRKFFYKHEMNSLIQILKRRMGGKYEYNDKY